MKKIPLILLLVFCASCQTQVSVRMSANKNLNPDTRKKNYQPVSVQVYQLLDDKKFKTASFFQLSDDPEKTLGADYLGAPSSFMISPDEKKNVSFKLDSKAKYFGVVADFQVLDNSKWKVVVPADSDLTIQIKDKTLTVH